MTSPHPVRLVFEDDLRRSRLTVFFRLLLAIPHYVWIAIWSVGVVFAVLIAWVAGLVLGRVPGPLHRFLAAYVRYSTHLTAYLTLAANPYPGFAGAAGSYPIDVEIDDPAPQPRWTILLRIFLVVPAALLAFALAGGSDWGGGIVAAIAFLGWFYALVRGRMPAGFEGALAYALRYLAQFDAYLLLLTSRYPESDPGAAVVERPAHPVRLSVTDDLRRSRLTVFFRLLLWLPHLVWFTLWTVVAVVAVIVNWVVTLVRGTSPAALHRFLAAYVRYTVHVSSFLYLVGNPFPGFTGAAGSYPIDPAIPAPERQSRWVTLFRLFLAVPAIVIMSALGNLLLAVAILGWFYSLVRGQMSPGLRNLGAYGLRYTAQTDAYLFLLTARYPHAAPPA